MYKKIKGKDFFHSFVIHRNKEEKYSLEVMLMTEIE